MQGMRAVCGSYFVTTYIQKQTTWRKGEEMKKGMKRKEKRRINKITQRKASAIQLSNTFSKRKSIAVKFQE